MKESVQEFLDTLYGFRKTIAWFSLFIVSIIFRCYGLLSGEQFVDLIKASFGGFLAGNVSEHLISFGKDFIASKIPKSDSNG